MSDVANGEISGGPEFADTASTQDSLDGRSQAEIDFALYSAQVMGQLYGIGPDKPMGYLPSYAITALSGKSVEQVAEELRQQNLKVHWYDSNESNIHSGALYAYDEQAVQDLLDKNSYVLAESGWPAMAEEFVERVVVETAPAFTPLFDLIADLFADITNPLRSNNRT